MPFGKLQAGCNVTFTEEWLLSGTLEALWSSVLGYFPDQGPYLPIVQFARAASSRKKLGGSKLLPFKNDGGHCVSGDLQCCRTFLVPFPRSVPRHNPALELYGQFLRPHGLVIAITCMTINREVCAYPNHVNQLNLPQVDSNQVVETSQ